MANVNLQQTIDAVPSRGGTIELGPINYYADGPLNIRDRRYIRIIGQGRATKLIFRTAIDQELLADCSGAVEFEMANLDVLRTGGVPRVGFLLGRGVSGSSANKMRFTRVHFEADCSVANVVSLGVECDVWDHCTFVTAIPGSWNYVTGKSNWIGATSPFGPVTGGSNIDHAFRDCHFAHYAKSGTDGNVWLMDGTGYVDISGGSWSNKFDDTSPPSSAWESVALRIGGPVDHHYCYAITLRDLQMETYGVKNAVDVYGDVRGLRMTGGMYCSQESGLYVRGKLRDSYIAGPMWHSGMALYDWGTKGRRATVHVENGWVSDTEIDLRGRWLNRLRRDWPSHATRQAPEVAILASGASHLEQLDVTAQQAGDVVIDDGVETENVTVSATHANGN